MKRDLQQLADHTYDLLIIGGGIYGACVAWEATLRGLEVALVDKADFGSATSANSLKIIHGGLRYLQHADLRRMRTSIRERQTLMRIAPHLVHPLPVMLPTYGHRLQGKAVLSAALRVNDLMSFDRNRLHDPQKYIPQGRTMSRRECLQHIPGLEPRGLTGGVVFYDAQLYNSERLLLAFLHSAASAGAVLANYVEVVGFLEAGDTVTGVKVCDRLSGERFDIGARAVVNTCGPWVNRVLHLLRRRPPYSLRFAKAINLVTRALFPTHAVGLPSRHDDRDTDAVFNKGNRLFFIAPWRGHSLIGTAYAVYDRDPETFCVTEQDVQSFLDDVNQAYPPGNLQREDVAFVHGGLLPMVGTQAQTGHLQLAKHFQIHDYRHHGVQGLISVTGVKYTTARYVAEKVVDRVFVTWEQKPPPSVSAVTPLYGGQIDQFDIFLDAAMRQQCHRLDEETIGQLVCNYGTAYLDVLRYVDDTAPAETSQGAAASAVLRAEILHGVRQEMAQNVTDVVLRRTELGTAGHPGRARLRLCAEVMGAELGWSPARMRQERQEAETVFAVGREA